MNDSSGNSSPLLFICVFSSALKYILKVFSSVLVNYHMPLVVQLNVP